MKIAKSDCLKCWQMLIAPKKGCKCQNCNQNLQKYNLDNFMVLLLCTFLKPGLEILARINVHFTVVVKTQELPQQSTNTTEKLKSTNSTSIWSV